MTLSLLYRPQTTSLHLTRFSAVASLFLQLQCPHSTVFSPIFFR